MPPDTEEDAKEYTKCHLTQKMQKNTQRHSQWRSKEGGGQVVERAPERSRP